MKNSIIETSLRGFLSHGIRKMTIQRLIAPLGISTKTVYKFFGDKEDLLKHCLVLHYSELSNEFRHLIDDHQSQPLVAIRLIWLKAFEADFGVNHIFYADLNHYYPELQDSVLNKIFKANLTPVENIVKSGMAKGVFRKDIDPGVVVRTLTLLYTTLTRTNQYARLKLSGDALFVNTIDTYLRGICTEAGLREYPDSKPALRP